VLAWHALQGYWSGLDAEALPQYQVWETPRHFSPGILHHFPQANTQYWGSAASVISPEHIGQFFDDYHALLQSQGVDGVKVDNQAAMEGLTRDVPRVALYQAYRRALEESVAAHFGGRVLHCMSCANDLLYAAGDTPLTRTSTDFWPKKPETHGLHVWTNALVSLWFGHFIHPDWDMFQSHLEGGWSEFHAAARAICGGPVYVSDKPRQHDAALLRRLVLSDGTLPRCDRPATIARDCLFEDVAHAPTLLKILNTNRQTTAGVIGLFNCHYNAEHPAPAITGTFTPADIPEIQGHGRYVVHLARGHGTGTLAFVAAPADRIAVSLAQAQYEIATIVPLEEGIAIVGLLDKLNPAATVGQITRNANSLHLTLRDAGTLGVWSDQPLKHIEQAGNRLPFTTNGNWITVPIPAPGEVILTL
jgi:raffinose synthase